MPPILLQEITLSYYSLSLPVFCPLYLKLKSMVVLIFDRSILISERLISLISEKMEGIIFYKADSYEEAIGLLDEFMPQVVLLDLNFPGNGTIPLLNKIRKANEKTVVIVLFSIADDHKLNLYKEHGADFLFDKYHEFEKIPPVIVGIPAMG